MITSISNTAQSKLLIKNNQHLSHKSFNSSRENSLMPLNYEVGLAIFAKNNISFKNNNKKDVLIDSVFTEKVKENSIQTKYFYDSKSKRDDYIAFYTTMLLVFMTPPFHDASSNIHANTKKHYCDLKFNIQDDDQKTYKSCYEKQQQLMKVVYNTNFETTLESLKEYDKELLDEDYKNGEIDNITKENNIKIIDNISSYDVKLHMKKYLLGCKPFVTV